jgi:hypothetical protein
VRRLTLVAAVVCLIVPAVAAADYLEVRRAATLKAEPDSGAAVVARPEVGALLILLDDEQINGYYLARPASGGPSGWIYRTLVRRYPGNIPGAVPPSENTDPIGPTTEGPSLSVCSFNIQFLGSSTRRNAPALASVVTGCDLVVVQELVAPPYAGQFPDGTPYNPDPQAAAFFDAMRADGYDFILSEEDTGTGNTNHLNSTATEWWVTFFRAGRVIAATDLPRGFLAADRTNHPDYERVPYAFPFRTTDGRLDFVLISVHLKPGGAASDAARRAHELAAIQVWRQAQSGSERDFIILGDMNFEDCDEIGSGVPAGLTSLNTECLPTNANVNGPRPYDNVLYDEQQTTEMDGAFGFVVINLIEAMASHWNAADGVYPGNPYDHNRFRAFFSDHHPVAFRLAIPNVDDDP